MMIPIDKKFQEARWNKILDILARGKVAVFTNNINGVVKKVNRADKTSEGDLTAFYSTGISPYVAWDTTQYDLSEE